MPMSAGQSEKWITVSAVAVAGVYAYRRLVEPAPKAAPDRKTKVKQVAGVGELPPLGTWATAWGFTFLVIAVIAEAAPSLGASLAILIATGDLLTNTKSIVVDVGAQEHGKGDTGTSSSSSLAGGSAGLSAAGAAADRIAATTPDPTAAGVASVAGAVDDPISAITLPFTGNSPPIFHTLPPPIVVPQVPILTRPMHGGTF